MTSITAKDIIDMLDDAGIKCYADSSNPDYTVHFDYKDRAFYFDTNEPGWPWVLIEIGRNNVIGTVNTQEELRELLLKL